MIPTVSQICCLNSPFETDIEDFAAGHCRSVEIWLTKLETYLQNHTLEDVRDLLKASSSDMGFSSCHVETCGGLRRGELYGGRSSARSRSRAG